MTRPLAPSVSAPSFNDSWQLAAATTPDGQHLTLVALGPCYGQRNPAFAVYIWQSSAMQGVPAIRRFPWTAAGERGARQALVVGCEVAA